MFDADYPNIGIDRSQTGFKLTRVKLSIFKRLTKKGRGGINLAFLKWYRRNCKTCGEIIILGEIDYNQWRAFDLPENGCWHYHKH